MCHPLSIREAALQVRFEISREKAYYAKRMLAKLVRARTGLLIFQHSGHNPFHLDTWMAHVLVHTLVWLTRFRERR